MTKTVHVMYKNKVYRKSIDFPKDETDPMLEYVLFLRDIVDVGTDLDEFFSEGFDVDEEFSDFNGEFVYEIDDDNKVWFCDYDFNQKWVCISDFKRRTPA